MHITCASSVSKLCNLTFYHSETMDPCNVRILDYDRKITIRRHVKQFAFPIPLTSLSLEVNLSQNWLTLDTFKALGRCKFIYGICICMLTKVHGRNLTHLLSFEYITAYRSDVLRQHNSWMCADAIFSNHYDDLIVVMMWQKLYYATKIALPPINKLSLGGIGRPITRQFNNYTCFIFASFSRIFCFF